MGWPADEAAVAVVAAAAAAAAVDDHHDPATKNKTLSIVLVMHLTMRIL